MSSTFSMEPDEMRELVEESKKIWLAMGNIKYGATDQEKDSLKYRRSLYFASDLKKGQIIKDSDIKSIRPGFGLRPEYKDVVVGRCVKEEVKIGTPVSWGLI